jgi:sulfatase maturation enzyme AslB (radical SAM superfamily)
MKLFIAMNHQVNNFLMVNNKSICSAFWNHTNIRGGDRVFPCCRFKQPIAQFDGKLDTVLLSPEYHQLRERSLKGEPISECQKCYNEEELGKKSLRQEFNETYNTKTVELKFLEIGFDNICNLTCDGCWGEFSSAWANIENPNVQKKLNILNTTEITDIPESIERIIFLGGEPLMTNKHYRFLKKLKNLSNVSLTYYTNGTFLFEQQELDLLSQFKKVEIMLSIDGYAELNESVRSGSHWDDILKFIEQIKSTSFDFTIHSVIHVNNWFGFHDLSNFIESVKIKWTTNILTYPGKLDIINLTPSDKNKLKELLESINNFPNKEYVLNHIKK